MAAQPLMRRQLIDLLIEVEGCAALVFETAAVLERVIAIAQRKIAACCSS